MAILIHYSSYDSITRTDIRLVHFVIDADSWLNSPSRQEFRPHKRGKNYDEDYRNVLTKHEPIRLIHLFCIVQRYFPRFCTRSLDRIGVRGLEWIRLFQYRLIAGYAVIFSPTYKRKRPTRSLFILGPNQIVLCVSRLEITGCVVILGMQPITWVRLGRTKLSLARHDGDHEQKKKNVRSHDSDSVQVNFFVSRLSIATSIQFEERGQRRRIEL